MIRHSLREIAAITGGRATADAVVAGIGTDSRAVRPGDLFVALRGEVHDGHRFVGGALAGGAAAALVDDEAALSGAPGVVVPDTLDALATLAGNLRRRLPVRVVAVTGSVGKTSTKDLIAAAVAPALTVVAAQGSYNNEIGVPLTLLAADERTQVVVAEVGARGRGHIADLMSVVAPDIAVVTAVSGAHLEQFGDLDTVAAAKGELVEGLGRSGVAILNGDDDRVAAMRHRHDGRSLLVSAAGAAGADVVARGIELDAGARARFVVQTPDGSADVELPVAGPHHVTNALLALAAATTLGVPVETAAAGLRSARLSRWRTEVVRAAGVTILNDAYNANPTSMVAAFDTLAAMAVDGRRWAVLGVMAELGADRHQQDHVDVGARCAQAGVDRLVVVGRDASGIAAGAREAGLTDVVEVDDAAGALAVLDEVAPGDAVLCKASRVGGLEVVAERLAERLGGQAGVASAAGASAAASAGEGTP